MSVRMVVLPSRPSLVGARTAGINGGDYVNAPPRRYRERARVRAALRAAARRLAGPFVRIAFFAAARRSRGLRLIAARCACAASAGRDAEDLGSRRSARRTARDRLADGRLRLRPRATSRAAFRAVCFEVFPAFGGGSFTPARRAFDS